MESESREFQDHIGLASRMNLHVSIHHVVRVQEMFATHGAHAHDENPIEIPLNPDFLSVFLWFWKWMA